MSKTAGLVALLVMVSTHSALCQNLPNQLSNGLPGAGSMAYPYGGNDRWGDDHWRDNRWGDDRFGGNGMVMPNGQSGMPQSGMPQSGMPQSGMPQSGMPNGNNGAGMPSTKKAQRALKAQGNNVNGMTSGNPYDRPYYQDNYNNPYDAGNSNASDIRKNLSGQGLPNPGR